MSRPPVELAIYRWQEKIAYRIRIESVFATADLPLFELTITKSLNSDFMFAHHLGALIAKTLEVAGERKIKGKFVCRSLRLRFGENQG